MLAVNGLGIESALMFVPPHDKIDEIVQESLGNVVGSTVFRAVLVEHEEVEPLVGIFGRPCHFDLCDESMPHLYNISIIVPLAEETFDAVSRRESHRGHTELSWQSASHGELCYVLTELCLALGNQNGVDCDVVDRLGITEIVDEVVDADQLERTQIAILCSNKHCDYL